MPALDIFETGSAVIIRVELPGVSSEDIRVNTDADLIRIGGVRRTPEGLDVAKLHQMEIAFGPFHREIKISVPFDQDRVSAHLVDGFLSISLPKVTPSGRSVPVEKE